jgi:ubiquitin carboxyl-terminal hydrolase 16
MPEKPLTIATYAAGASLAAITLVYVFGPTFFIDGESSTNSSSTRRKGVVGLSNPANDCFINSVLQSLAGLGDLRIYLIRESHRRKLDGRDVYRVSGEELEKLKREDAIKLEGLRRGIVTRGLKEILDSLNERPIYRKTISASGFVEDIEVAFRQKISRQQQDAQEFLQLVAERLGDEYHAGRRARSKSTESPINGNIESSGEELENTADLTASKTSPQDPTEPDQAPSEQGPEISGSNHQVNDDVEEGFPLEGRQESQVECLTCRFKPKPSVSSFVTLTLNVPRSAATTLNNCFDGLFQTEYIDDYKCDRCRLEDAIERRLQLLSKTADGREKAKIELDLGKLSEAIKDDPEKPPDGVELPDMKTVPTRKIARHVRITSFPKVLAIHLSRSIFDPRSSSLKNSAKVSFPETLALGGILNPKKYKLLGVVTHKGSHNSGHYESFRRQNLYPPFSTPNVFRQGGAYGQSASPRSSAAPSPNISAIQTEKHFEENRPSSGLSGQASFFESVASTTQSPTPSKLPINSTSERLHSPLSSTTSILQSAQSPPGLHPSSVASGSSSRTKLESLDKTQQVTEMTRFKRRKKINDRWWRISDEKVKECKTNDVLNMQKEVYLLFYEMDKSTENEK